MFHYSRTVFFALLMLCGLAACTTLPDTPTRSIPSPTPTAPAVTAQPLPPTSVPDTPITLTLWLPTRFASQEGNPAYQVLQRQLGDFARSADGVPGRIVVKADHGPGGLLDLLRTASPVAPAVLPDVIALDETDLETAARTGLLSPIGSQLPADLTNDFFPFARSLGTVNGELYGLIYGADLEHLAGNSATPLPTTWSALLDGSRQYLFAIGNSDNNVSDAVVTHYLAAGGALTDGNGQPMLDEVALQTLLGTYLQAQAKNILLNNLIQLGNSDEVWAAWRGSGSAVVNVAASRFLSVEARLPNLEYAALPALMKAAQPIGRGWAYAVVTHDPRRQAAAIRLLEHLLTPANEGEWTRAADVLPGRAAALTTWDQSNAYTSFLRDQLTQAQAAPSAALMAIVGPPLRKAVEDVLAGRATPAEAARAAALTVNSGKK